MIRIPVDSDKQFFSIGELSVLTGIKPYILRYWENEFGIVRPMRRVSGQRKFTRRDLDLILQAKELIQDKGYTPKGAKKVLWSKKKTGPQQMKLEVEQDSVMRETLEYAKKETREILKLLKTS